MIIKETLKVEFGTCDGCSNKESIYYKTTGDTYKLECLTWDDANHEYTKGSICLECIKTFFNVD